MIVRHATIEDVPEMAKLHRMFCESSPLFKSFGGIREREQINWLAEATRRESSFAIVAEPEGEKGNLVGITMIEIYRMSMFAPLMARDMFSYTNPAYRSFGWVYKAFQMVQEEAENHGVAVVFYNAIGASTEDNTRNGQLLKKLGCDPVGVIGVKGV